MNSARPNAPHPAKRPFQQTSHPEPAGCRRHRSIRKSSRSCQHLLRCLYLEKHIPVMQLQESRRSPPALERRRSQRRKATCSNHLCRRQRRVDDNTACMPPNRIYTAPNCCGYRSGAVRLMYQSQSVQRRRLAAIQLAAFLPATARSHRWKQALPPADIRALPRGRRQQSADSFRAANPAAADPTKHL